ncbi:MAG: glutamate-5-semialdehyde dehydrogenase [Calditrichaeota bacterium]|nr:MAG: glutamate-5-semialdehyde dehydrogenase [Calditrichota bacterium]
MSGNMSINTCAEMARACRAASRVVARLNSDSKNTLLLDMAAGLRENMERILSANNRDIELARQAKLSDVLIDRLLLTPARLEAMASAMQDIAALPDPVGEITKTWHRPNGLTVSYQRIPLGVIGIIYESRPNVTADAAALCFKAGNAVFLRGGSEAFHSNQAIVTVLHHALEQHDLQSAAITMPASTERSVIMDMLNCSEDIDLIIPRGGEGLVRFVTENSRIPVIKHYKGVCHQYVDYNADIHMAIDLLVDGKCSRPGVCNALETLLVHEAIAGEFLPRAAAALSRQGVTLRGCEKTRHYVPDIEPATEDDYYAEYLSLTLAIKVVAGLEEAVSHIEQDVSDHTEVIVTRDYENARRFLSLINSSVVLVNASSRFSDGGQLGLGAEIGISTTKLHAYGPMGLESLTTQKFIVTGDGQTRHGLPWE